MLDSNSIENSFDVLLTAFSDRAASAFSSCLFSVQYNKFGTTDSFEKLIYNKGNQQEVYTKSERQLIDRISQYHICSEFHIREKHQRILCRIIAINLSFSESLIHDAIATMKICNKALEGYNLYILVGEETLHIGCDILGDPGRTGCTISYPIEKNINWEALIYNFLEIIDDKGFIEYYHSLIDAISYVYNCYNKDVPSYEPLPITQEDYNNEWYDVSDESLYHDYDESAELLCDKFLCFIREVEDIKKDLSFITTNKINTLEMLFEAEEQVEKAENTPHAVEISEESNDDHYNDYKSLLSSPEELIKALKNRNK